MKKVFKYLAIILGVLVIVAVYLGLWLYRGNLTQAKIKVFNYLPFPMASVDGHFIPINKFILRYNISLKTVTPDTNQAKQIQQGIATELINEKKTAILASNKSVTVNNNQIETAYWDASKQAEAQGQGSLEQQLKTYGLTPALYKGEVLQPDLLQTNLQTWFYSQPELNQDGYKLANDLVQKIQKGDNMAMLAQQYSQEQQDKSTGGDLGLVNSVDILPELRETSESLKVGEVKIAACRYGIYVIRLEDKQGPLLHLREISLNGSDFQAWYNNETKNYSVHQFLNF